MTSDRDTFGPQKGPPDGDPANPDFGGTESSIPTAATEKTAPESTAQEDAGRSS